jgi:hypothetical protein
LIAALEASRRVPLSCWQYGSTEEGHREQLFWTAAASLLLIGLAWYEVRHLMASLSKAKEEAKAAWG